MLQKCINKCVLFMFIFCVFLPSLLFLPPSKIPSILPPFPFLLPPSSLPSSQLLEVFNLTDLIASATAGIGNLTIDGSSLVPSDLVDSLRSSLPNVTELDFSASLLATVNSSLVEASMALKDASAQLANFTQMLNDVSGANVRIYYSIWHVVTVCIAALYCSIVCACM